MTAPRVLVLGCGSIGSRHARLLVAAGASVAVTDPDPTRGTNLPGVQRLPWGADGAGFDGVVVASPTRWHAEQACQALAAGAKVLVEKPLATTAPEAAAIVDAGEDRVAVAFNLRFHEPLQRARDHSGGLGPVLAARFWSGSYLPEWRPGVDYRTTYSARADMGGGVLLDAIHELDLVVWWFGRDVAVAAALVQRCGDLEIDVEDTVKALLITPGGAPVEVSLDYLSRRYRRGVELVGRDATLRLDWAREVLEIEDAQAVRSQPAAVAVARSYELQARAFVSWLSGGPRLPVDAETGAASLRLALDIRATAGT